MGKSGNSVQPGKWPPYILHWMFFFFMVLMYHCVQNCSSALQCCVLMFVLLSFITLYYLVTDFVIFITTRRVFCHCGAPGMFQLLTRFGHVLSNMVSCWLSTICWTRDVYKHTCWCWHKLCITNLRGGGGKKNVRHGQIFTYWYMEDINRNKMHWYCLEW